MTSPNTAASSRTKCGKCGSGRIIPDLVISDQAGHYVRLGVNVYEHPDATLFKGKHAALIRSTVCGDCGYVESYVDNPAELYAIYVQAQAERTS